MPSLPQVRQKSPNEVVFLSPFGIAFEHVSRAIGQLGTLKRQDKTQQFVEGRIKYGLQSVKVHVSLIERVEGETTAVIQASSDDIWGAGAKSATKRLVETLVNLDNPGYQPDRLGIHPAALVGLLIGFVYLVMIIMKYVLPLIFG